MPLPDRKRLFQIIDAEGESYFVQEETFAEAVASFVLWGGSQEDIDSVAHAGYLIDPSFNDSLPLVLERKGGS